MALASLFRCTKTPCIHFKLTTPTYIPISRRNLLIPSGKKSLLEPIFVTGNTKKCIIKQRRKMEIGPTLAATSDSSSEILSTSDVIKKFYTCINKKDRKGLEELIANNCCVQDMAFPYVIQGKKEVISVFVQLAESMGQSVQFKLGTICEGDELTASVLWHLEWKDDQIPFSRGCSVFQCSNEGDKLVIRNVQIITESPIKPGILAMASLKMVRSTFDEFPKATKWFLKSPQAISKAVMNFYKIFLAPIVNPVLKFYVTLWKYMARTLGYAIRFLHIITRFFSKESSSTDNDNDTPKREGEQGPTSLP